MGSHAHPRGTGSTSWPADLAPEDPEGHSAPKSWTRLPSVRDRLNVRDAKRGPTHDGPALASRPGHSVDHGRKATSSMISARNAAPGPPAPGPPASLSNQFPSDAHVNPSAMDAPAAGSARYTPVTSPAHPLRPSDVCPGSSTDSNTEFCSSLSAVIAPWYRVAGS